MIAVLSGCGTPPCLLSRRPGLHDGMAVPSAVNQFAAAEPLHQPGDKADLREPVMEIGQEPGAVEEAGEREDQLLRSEYPPERAVRIELSLQGEQSGGFRTDHRISLFLKEQPKVGQYALITFNRRGMPAGGTRSKVPGQDFIYRNVIHAFQCALCH